jgi:hypothetical protein
MLLTNGWSPVYAPHAGPTALHDAIRATAEALDGHWRRAQQP